VNVADIQQPAGVGARRKPLHAYGQRPGQPDLERCVRPRPSRIPGSILCMHRELCMEKYNRVELRLCAPRSRHAT
jgi:hypothetical protein